MSERRDGFALLPACASRSFGRTAHWRLLPKPCRMANPRRPSPRPAVRLHCYPGGGPSRPLPTGKGPALCLSASVRQASVEMSENG
ncbi:hypothetical protein CG51_16770 [Haematobacter missouriensis]|nr:hypothetical protein CG51_16770 [Haematobacter missouriensis]